MARGEGWPKNVTISQKMRTLENAGKEARGWLYVR